MCGKRANMQEEVYEKWRNNVPIYCQGIMKRAFLMPTKLGRF
jgi:hypothetical protein